MQSIIYKGYEITPVSQQLSGSNEWTLRVSITKHRDSENVTNDQVFDANNTSPTENEAETASIEVGKKNYR